MPYLAQDFRITIEKQIDLESSCSYFTSLEVKYQAEALRYMIDELVLHSFNRNGLNYFKFNNVMGALTCTWKELDRRFLKDMKNIDKTRYIAEENISFELRTEIWNKCELERTKAYYVSLQSEQQCGFLNYYITKLAKTSLLKKGVSFGLVSYYIESIAKIADTLYTIVGGPYEDEKIEQNGDVEVWDATK